MNHAKLSSLLKISGIVLAALAGLTLVPSPGASKKSRLGYKAKCSFAPFSTLLTAALAAAAFVIRSVLMKGA